jgi:flagellar protein FlaG
VEGIEKAIDNINQSIASFHRHMNISVHQRTNRIMVKVMDTEKNEVIREIPPERVLDAFAKALELAGVLLDERR